VVVFFDRVNHDLLMGLVARRVHDKRVLRLIRGFLTAGVLADGLVRPTDEGTPQGGPLSPLLSNLMLDVLDKELERRGHRFVRYADDCNIYVQSRRAGERVMASVERFLTSHLKLKVNSAKSAVARPAARKFLGFSFTDEAEPRRRIASQALARFTSRVRALTRRTVGVSLEQAIARLSIYLTGWRGYFGFCQTPELLRNLEGWVRRRLRCLVWTQWRTGRRRYIALRQHGIDPSPAATTTAAARRHGPWRLSRHPVLQAALSNAFFAAGGLPVLAPAVA
jgi:RNA-directed DNA polymerase